MTESQTKDDESRAQSGQRLTLTAQEFQESPGVEDWRVLGIGAGAWFTTTSHSAGAALAARAVELAGGLPLDVSVRSRGVQVRLPLGPTDDGLTDQHVSVARSVSAAAAQLSLTADPTVLEDLQLTMDTMDQATVLPFWEAALGYEPVGDEDLLDPLRRHPPIWFQDQDAPRPLRNRVHLDAVKAQEVAVATVKALRERGARTVDDHSYYATVADAEGNEVDVLPLPEDADRWPGAETEDWRLVFSAMACYPVQSPAQAAELATSVAALADEADLPLGIDVRPGLVVLDSGKDRWEMTEGYEKLAGQVQETARALGLTADVTLPRFAQIGIDAVDVPAVREFWRVALGYEEDPRPDVTDIVDPRQVNVPLFFQPMEATDEARRAQRNRIHVDLFLPDGQLRGRLDAALAAGGTVVRDEGPISWTVADPEGNEIDLTTSVGREELWADNAG